MITQGMPKSRFMKKMELKDCLLTYKQRVECSHNPNLELRERDRCLAQLNTPKLQKHIRSQVAEAKDEADSKWVSILKKYKVTVDSPESLAIAVEQLIAEAVKAKLKEIEALFDDIPAPITFVRLHSVEDCFLIRVADWQAFSGD